MGPDRSVISPTPPPAPTSHSPAIDVILRAKALEFFSLPSLALPPFRVFRQGGVLAGNGCFGPCPLGCRGDASRELVVSGCTTRESTPSPSSPPSGNPPFRAPKGDIWGPTQREREGEGTGCPGRDASPLAPGHAKEKKQQEQKGGCACQAWED